MNIVQQRQMQKILLVIPDFSMTNANVRKGAVRTKCYYDYPFPIGIPYVAAALKNAGYSYKALNLNNFLNPEKVLSEELEKKYDFVMTGGNSLIFECLNWIVNLSREIATESTVIVGGPLITTEPELMAQNMAFDYGVIGEGEITDVKLLDALCYGEPPESVPGIVFRNKNGTVTRTGTGAFYENLDDVPFPRVEDFGYDIWLDHALCSSYSFSYFDYPRPYIIMGSRGCPFQCTFCFHDQKFRTRSMDNIFDELKSVIPKYKINLIQVNDDCFAVTKERVYEFCRRIHQLSQEVGWEIQWTVQLTVKNISPELLRIMKQSGCNSISYGFESYSAEILKSMKKPISPDEINYAFLQTMDAGITVQANFIFGDLAENRKTYLETLEYWKKCKGQISLGTIALYPGSYLYHSSCQRGIITNRFKFIREKLGSIINFTLNMDNQQFKKMLYDIFDYSFLYQKKCIVFQKVPPYHRLYCPYCGQRLPGINMPDLVNDALRFTCRYCHMQFQVIYFSTYIKMLLIYLKHRLQSVVCRRERGFYGKT